jgi:hypothetical protein
VSGVFGGGRKEGRRPAAAPSEVTGPPTAWPDGTPAGTAPPPGAPPASAAAWRPGVAAQPGVSPPGGAPPFGPLGGGPSHRPPGGPRYGPSRVGPSGTGAGWAAGGGSPTTPGRGRSFLAALAVLAVVAAVAAVVLVADPFASTTDEASASWRDGARAEDLESDDPDEPTGQDDGAAATTTEPATTTTAPPERLAPAPVPPSEPGPHAFLAEEDDGDPISWDPCEPIRYVVNARTAPPEGAELLAEALAKVSAATGLVFEDVGATDEVPTIEQRPQRDPARYGEDWSPVLIAWTDPAEVADLAGPVGGVGTPDWAPTGDGEYESVTGIVHLDGPDVAHFLAEGWRTDAQHLLVHELGHLMGLDHVDDTQQVMYHNQGERGEIDAEWNVGDLTGLAILGNGDCDPGA